MPESALQVASDLLCSVEGPEVVFVGSISRTWYEDLSRIVEILDWLQLHGCLVRVGGRAGFDLHVERLAERVEVPVVNFGPDRLEDRLKVVECTPDILIGATLVVAFSERGTHDVFTADPLVEHALGNDVPVLSFDQDGTGSFITLHNQIYM